MFLEGLEFFFVLGFFKTDLKKVIANQKNIGPFSPLRGLIDIKTVTPRLCEWPYISKKNHKNAKIRCPFRALRMQFPAKLRHTSQKIHSKPNLSIPSDMVNLSKSKKNE